MESLFVGWCRRADTSVLALVNCDLRGRSPNGPSRTFLKIPSDEKGLDISVEDSNEYGRMRFRCSKLVIYTLPPWSPGKSS